MSTAVIGNTARKTGWDRMLKGGFKELGLDLVFKGSCGRFFWGGSAVIKAIQQ